FTLQSGPAGMSIDAVTGLVRWTPTAGQVGTQDVVVVADDGLGGTATQRFTVSGAAGPRDPPPRVTSRPAPVATEGIAYPYHVTATDTEGEGITFLLLQGPANMSIAGSGALSWVPTLGQVGTVDVSVAARDANGATAVQHFAVTVAEDNGAPS